MDMVNIQLGFGKHISHHKAKRRLCAPKGKQITRAGQIPFELTHHTGMVLAANGDLVRTADTVLPHPLAKAIQHYAFGQATSPDVTNFQRANNRPGIGGKAVADPITPQLST